MNMPLVTGDTDLQPDDAETEKLTPTYIQRVWKLLDAYFMWRRMQKRNAEKESEGEPQQKKDDEASS